MPANHFVLGGLQAPGGNEDDEDYKRELAKAMQDIKTLGAGRWAGRKGVCCQRFLRCLAGGPPALPEPST